MLLMYFMSKTNVSFIVKERRRHLKVVPISEPGVLLGIDSAKSNKSTARPAVDKDVSPCLTDHPPPRAALPAMRKKRR